MPRLCGQLGQSKNLHAELQGIQDCVGLRAGSAGWLTFTAPRWTRTSHNHIKSVVLYQMS